MKNRNNTKYTEQQIRQVCSLLLDPSLKYKEIEKITGVGKKLISDIRSGRRWSDISQDFHFPEKKWNKEIMKEVANQLKEGIPNKTIAENLDMKYDNSFICFCNKVKRGLNK